MDTVKEELLNTVVESAKKQVHYRLSVRRQLCEAREALASTSKDESALRESIRNCEQVLGEAGYAGPEYEATPATEIAHLIATAREWGAGNLLVAACPLVLAASDLLSDFASVIQEADQFPGFTWVGLIEQFESQAIDLAGLCLANGDNDLAERLYLEASGWGDPRGCFCLGTLWMKDGDFKNALDMFKDVIENDPDEGEYDHGDVLSEIGICQVELEQYSDAIKTLDSARSMVTLDTKTEVCYARALAGVGKIEEAISVLGGITGRQPSNFDAHLHIGVIQLEQDDDERALENLRTALSLREDDFLANFYYGQALWKAHRHGEALAVFQRPIFDDTTEIMVHLIRGWCYENLDDWHAAFLEFEKALQLDPEDYLANANYGLACAREDKNEEAIKCLTKVVAIEPKHKNAHQTLIEIYHKTGREELAKRQLNALRQISPRFADKVAKRIGLM